MFAIEKKNPNEEKEEKKQSNANKQWLTYMRIADRRNEELKLGYGFGITIILFIYREIGH